MSGMLSSNRYFQALRSFPELLVGTAFGVALLALRMWIPPELQLSLGWQIHPYQVLIVCTALALFLMPGALLMRLLGVGVSWPTRLPTIAAASLGVWVAPSMLVASTARFNAEHLVLFGLIATVLLAVATYLRLLLRPADPSDPDLEEGVADQSDPLNPGLVVLGAASLIAAAAFSFAAPVALDDSLQVMYVQDNLVVPRINEYEPVFGAGIRPHTRGSLTTWPVNLTALAWLSGLPPQQTYWLLRTPLVLLDLLAIYALSLRFFGSRNQAIFTGLLYFILSFVYTDDADAIGFGLYARGAQDKFVARYTLLPMALAWSIAYLRRQDAKSYWLAGACTIGLAASHPIGVVLIAIPLGALGLVHTIRHLQIRRLRSPAQGSRSVGSSLRRAWDWVRRLGGQNWPMLRPFILLSVFSLVGLVVPLVQKASPDAPVVAYSLTDTRDPTLWFRVNLAVNFQRLWVADYLGPEAYIVHPRVFLEAVILLPLLGLPLVWLKARDRMLSELLVGTFLFNSVLLLVPPLVQFLGARTTPWLLYRFAWPLSLLGPIVLAWGGWVALMLLGRRISSAVLRTALPVLTLLAATAALNQEIRRGLTTLQEYRADSFPSLCRTLQPLYTGLESLVGDGTVVLSTSDNNLCMVSSVANAYPVEFGLTTTLNRFPESRLAEANQRLEDVFDFTFASVIDQPLMDLLARWNVGLILLRADHPLASQLSLMTDFFTLEFVEGRYLIYRVRPGVGIDRMSDLAVRDRWRNATWQGQDPLVTANTLWSQGRFEEAISAYRPLVQASGSRGHLALVGLGRALLSTGRLDDAQAALAEAAERNDGSVQGWMLAADAYRLASQYDLMAHAYQQVLLTYDWHPGAWMGLADAYRLQGQQGLARDSYQRAVQADITAGTSSYYEALASAFLAVNWTSEAVASVQQSLDIRDSLQAYSLLSKAQIRRGDLDRALDAAQQARWLDPWSDIPDLLLADLELEKGDRERAINHFRSSLTLNPQSEAVYGLGSAVSSQHGEAAALDQIQDLVGFRLGFFDPVLAAAVRLRALGYFDEAASAGESAWRWKPVDSRAPVFLGELLFGQGRRDSSEDFFREAIGINPFSPAAYLGLAAVAQVRGDWTTSLGWGWAAMTSAPNNPAGALGFARISQTRGDYGEAGEQYGSALRIDPFDHSTHSALAAFLLDRGHIAGARRSYEAALALDPQSSLALRGLAQLELSQGRISEAVDLLQRAVESSPGEGANRVAFALALLRRGDPEAAFEQLAEALRVDPGYVPGHVALAEAYLRQSEPDLAEGLYRNLILNQPSSVEGYVGLGRLLERRGDLEAAGATYRRALDRLPAEISGAAGAELADLLLRMGDIGSAREVYQGVAESQPMFTIAYVQWALLEAQTGNLGEAGAILSRGLDLIPASPELNQALSRLQLAQGQVAIATETLKDALDYAPSSTRLWVGLAQLYAAVGEPASALETLNQALGTWPGDTYLVSGAASLNIALGRPQVGLEMARDAVEASPGSARAWMVLGDAHSALGEYDFAAEAYRQATQIEPGDVGPWLALSQHEASRGNLPEALDALERARATDQSAPAPLLAMGSILTTQGRLAEALERYGTAAELNPSNPEPLLEIASLRQFEGDLTAARRTLDRALEAAPTSDRVFLARAELLSIQGQLDQAEKELQSAVQAMPGSCQAALNYADHLAEWAGGQAAEQAYQRALQLPGCQARSRIGLGNLLWRQGELELAIGQFQLAVAASPGEAWGYIVLSNAYLFQGNGQQAMAVLDQASQGLPASTPIAIARSRQLLARGELTGALAAAQEAVRIAPSNPATSLALAEVSRAQGSFEQARQNYQRAADLDHMLAIPYLRLGGLFASLAQFEDAEAAFQRAIELSPFDPNLYIGLGDFLQTRARWDEAEASYQRGVDADRSQVGALLSLAALRARRGEIDAALQDLELAIRVGPGGLGEAFDPSEFEFDLASAPSTLRAYLVLGDIRRTIGDWMGAEVAYRMAADAAPGDFEAFIRLGSAHQAQGEDEALSWFEKAVALAPGSPRAHIALGDWYRLQGAREAARSEYLAAIEVAPGSASGYVRLGELFQGSGRLEDAAAQFEAAIQRAPASVIARLAMGDYLRSQADPGSAKQAYLEAITIGPANPLARIALGDLLHTAGDRGGARQRFLEAMDIAPASPYPLLALAQWYGVEGAWDEAAEALQQATELAPDQLNGHLQLGYVFLAQGLAREAWAEIRRAQVLAPGDAGVQIAVGDWYRANLDMQATKEAAQAALDEAVDLLPQAELVGEPDEFIEYLIFGLDAWRHQRVVEAYDLFETAIAEDPTSELPYLAMGQWYRLVPEIQLAEQAYQNAIDLAPGELQAYLHLASLLEATRRTWEAQHELDRAMHVIPGAASSHLALGELYLNRGEFSLAESEFRQALALAPGEVNAYLRLAEALDAQGLQDESLAVLEAGLAAGLSEAATICGPGRLPSTWPGQTAAQNPSGGLYNLGAWRCQWDRRPWSQLEGHPASP